MKKYFHFLILTIILFVILFEGITIGVLTCNPGTYHTNYDSVIVDKYRILQNTNEPKIVIIAGSSSAFGLNQKMLEDATGYKVVNMGLDASFGPLFYSELAKENINAGDIVLLAYEYGWINGFDKLGQRDIMAGIDDNIDLYKHIPIGRWGDFIGFLFGYAAMKSEHKTYSGIYSREAFDEETAQLTWPRNSSIDYENHIDLFGTCDLGDATISENSIDYLSAFKSYIEKRHARVYFVAPPLLKDAIACDYSAFDLLRQYEEELIGIPYISDPNDYFFDKSLMCDTIYHCNAEGEVARTRQLIQDLTNANII